jgi:hypothetical protein
MATQQKHLGKILEYDLCNSFFSKIVIEKGYTTALSATIVINILLSIFGTVANGLIILAYCRNSRLRTIQNFIFLLLAFTDLSVTALVQPMLVVVNLGGIFGSTNSCVLLRVCALLSFVCVNLSLTTMVILSLQSFITLAYPYRYKTIITKFRLKITFFASWIFILSLTPIIAFQKKTRIAVYGSLVIILSSISIVVFTWIWTCRLVARHRRDIRANQNPSTPENVTKKKIIRSTVTAIVIISSLLGCYFFFVILLLYDAVNMGYDGSNSYVPWMVSITLVYSNSLINPCLVFRRNSELKKIACKFCSN